ncbi:MAG: leucine-rich repeat domain-containing protein, partial [Spirochaetaceae bacterium]|nr:leucine-rich repeat domain-containing protein [Spirochaetaceae bacterium]
LKSVEISGAVSIGDSAFKNCANLETISFPPRIAGAVSGAFAGCHNLSFTIRAGRGNLSSPDGKSLVLNGNTLLAAAESAVAIVGADSVYEVPAGIRELAADSLAGLGMTTVKIPASVDKIGERAFAGCASLTTVEIRAVTPPALILSGAAASFPAGITAIHVPSGSLSNYRGAWTQFSTDKFYGF